MNRPSSQNSNRRHLSIVTLLISLLCCSCMSVSKHIQPDERVLNHNYFDIKTTDGDNVGKETEAALSDMKKFVEQKPNTHFLKYGPRFYMRIYCLSDPKKDNFLHRYLRNKGQEPVVYDDNATIVTTNQITGLLESKGCFHSYVTFDTAWTKNQNIDVIYHIRTAPRYKIDDVFFYCETPEVDKLLRQWKDESLIQEGDYYDQDVMDAERSRIIDRLRNEGYYTASTDLVSYIVDTAFEDHKLTIRLNIRNPRVTDANRHTAIRPLQKYRIDNIYIYPNSSAASGRITPQFDTIVDSLVFRSLVTHYYHLTTQPMALKSRVIDRSMFLFSGQTYRPRNITRTYNSLIGLRNFKYINIEFSESPNSCDTNRLLNAKIRLLNAKRQRISASIEINNSSPFREQSDYGMSGNFGLETKVSYQNKNLFGGAEIFNTEASLLVELPKLIFKSKEDDFRKNFSNLETGLNLSLDLPTFLFPLSRDVLWQRTRPHTVITLSGNYQLHSYFERLMFNTGFGYSWSRNIHSHQLLPLELTFVRFFNIDSSFRNRMNQISDARVKYQYSDHFIMDARYDYIYNTQIYGTRADFNYFHFSFETAGNLLSAVSQIVVNKSLFSGAENQHFTVFGVPFSQYARINTEYKHYFYLPKNKTFVARINAGAGLPYGNSVVMPYEKGFYGGGPTTMRAWHLRHLGPGLFQHEEDDILERIGDIQLVVNLEYRFPLISIIEGALFCDMGNVWLTNESSEFPGGQFKLKELPKSIAIGPGIGLRANISIVTLRCDLAIPLYDPGYEQSHRWRPPYWSFSQFTANFGIDYPF